MLFDLLRVLFGKHGLSIKKPFKSHPSGGSHLDQSQTSADWQREDSATPPDKDDVVDILCSIKENLIAMDSKIGSMDRKYDEINQKLSDIKNDSEANNRKIDFMPEKFDKLSYDFNKLRIDVNEIDLDSKISRDLWGSTLLVNFVVFLFLCVIVVSAFYIWEYDLLF